MTSLSHNRNFDPAIIAGIAREVIQRLRAGEAKQSPETGAKLITIETLNQYSGASEIVAADGAVVTPAAREEAAQRGMKIVFGRTDVTQRCENNDSEPSNAFSNQLTRRGVSLPEGVEVVWTDRPADEVCRRCGAGQRATMITTLSDVDRFAKELAPSAWVLDQQKLNLVAAVNIAARIARIAKPANGGSL